jgi:RNA polymerase sigma-70 factor (ECF subfamily)
MPTTESRSSAGSVGAARDKLSPRCDDVTLIGAMSEGDQGAMALLYDRYAAPMLGLALRITREHADAEDVLVDAFDQVWREATRFDPGRGSVAGWLATITRSRALDLIRSRARRTRLDDVAEREGPVVPVAMGASQRSPVGDVLADERSTRVRAALADLPAAQRVALELAYFEGLSQTEIAARLAEPLGTIKTRMRLGMRRLRDLLASIGPGDGS